jgi:hypothetical protein
MEADPMIGLSDFLIAFLLNMTTAVIVVRWIYYPKHHSKKYIFSFLAFTTIIFFVVSLMSSVEMSIGVGFGLFAIFSVLRYRTNTIPIREMTYLFITAALPVMNGTATNGDHWVKLLIANIAVILVLFILENEWGFSFESSQTVVYEKINLLRPENYALLMRDLEDRTGFNINHFEVSQINFLRDTARIKVYYDENRQLRSLEIPEGTSLSPADDSLLFT